MELTKRLKTIAQYVQKGNVIADVGTDHGYIPIYLAINDIVSKAYAMDVREGPLAKAKQNIDLYGVTDKVETILSDGLKELGNRKVDTLIIAGMGGMLIHKILSEEQIKLKEIPNLILSPHLDVEQVRRTVHQLGYRILQEDFIEEEGKYYPIIICQHGQQHYTDLEYAYGKGFVDSCRTTYELYLKSIINQNNKLINKLTKSATPSSLERIKELEKKSQMISEVIKWL